MTGLKIAKTGLSVDLSLSGDGTLCCRAKAPA